MVRDIDRRDFLKIGLSGVIAASGYGISKYFGTNAFLFDHLRPVLDNKSEAFYKGMINYNRITRTTCAGNCTQACGWNAFVEGNTIIRSETAADYDRFDPVAGKAYLPRGCLRGASYIEYIYGPTRIKTPLIRNGPRGSGLFRKATWDEALDLIAERYIELIREDGPEALAMFSPIPAFTYISAACSYRLGRIMGAAGPMSFYDWYCDLPAGEPVTWGVQTEEAEEWDWVNGKLILIWGSNIAESRIAAAHFINEAKYRGSKVISILTDYNATSKMANESVSPKPGTDSALVLGIIKELIDNNWHDAPYIKTFTDLPFLVRTDTGKFLSENDMVGGGSKFRFYVWDSVAGKPVLAPGTMGDDRDTLDWESIGADPDLDYSGSVTVASGDSVAVETVWVRLKKMLRSDFTLEQVAQITGVAPDVIKGIARDLHELSPACIVEGGGTNHWYHNDLNNRIMIMLMAVTGNVGVNGGGFHQYTGQYRVWLMGMATYVPFPKSKALNTTLFMWTHIDKELWRLGKTFEEMVTGIEQGSLTALPDGSPVSTDPTNEMGYRHYLLIKSLSQGNMPVYPKPPQRLRAMLIMRGNFLNNAKGGYRLLEWFKDDKKMEFVVTADFRMSTTTLYSDVILPAASWYEKYEIETTPLHPYFQLQQEVVKPVFESKTDFEMVRLIARRIQDKALRMRKAGTWDGLWEDTTKGVTRDYTKLYDMFVDAEWKENPYFKGQGDGGLDSIPKVAHYIVRNSPLMFPEEEKYRGKKEAFAPELRPIIEAYLANGDKDAFAAGFLKLAEQGPIPFPGLQHDRPHNPFRENVRGKLPWPAGGKHKDKMIISKYPCVIPTKSGKTLTGRQQFYIDHEDYLQLGEALPTYKVPETDFVNGKPAPLKMNTPHGRYRTHSTFADLSILLRLQRSEAIVMMNTQDARERNIADGDLVEVFNDYGKFVCRAKLMPGIGRSMVRMDHAWESYQYHEGYFNLITPIRPNPLQAVRYPDDPDAPDRHLRYGWNLWGVCGNECDTSVDVRKV